jgi:hypothetical protein
VDQPRCTRVQALAWERVSRVRRAVVTFVALALLSATGCTSVRPHVDPDHLTPRQSLAPAEGKAPSPVTSRTPAVQPPARDALVKSSTDKPKPKGTKDTKAKATPRRAVPAVVDHTRPAPTPPRPPVRRAPVPPRPTVQRPERPAQVAPRPTRPRQTYDGRVACRMADGVADPALVALCRDRFGR